MQAFRYHPSSTEGQAHPVVGSRRRETGTANVRFARFNAEAGPTEIGQVWRFK
jgi:hypothetical protein